MKKTDIQLQIAELEEQIKLEYQNLGKAILECTKAGGIRVDALVDRVIALKQKINTISDRNDMER